MGPSVAALMEAFGAYVTPYLLALTGDAANDGQDPLKALEQVGPMVNMLFGPCVGGEARPEVAVRRVSVARVVVTVRSGQGVCAVAKGLARGVARSCHEAVCILESRCTERGDAGCTIAMRCRLRPAAPAARRPGWMRVAAMASRR
jgi:hypothetical protein